MKIAGKNWQDAVKRTGPTGIFFRAVAVTNKRKGCESLSIFCTFAISINVLSLRKIERIVVNRFQFFVPLQSL